MNGRGRRDAPPPASPASDAAGPVPIDRREAIHRTVWLLGGVSLVGGGGLLTACESVPRPVDREPIGDFTVEDQDLLDEIAETILPETDTPGARAAGVGPFMALMVTDVYSPREQEVFRAGMLRIRGEMVRRHGVGFTEVEPAQRLTFVEELDREQLDYVPAPPTEGGEAAPPHFFRMMKQLTLLGYFTSEIGCTLALQYVESPGRYDPCVPYTPGERAWASHA